MSAFELFPTPKKAAVKKAAAKVEEAVVEAPAPALPEVVATKSYKTDDWHPYAPGRVEYPWITAVKFADGSEWHLGTGWQK